MLQAEARATSGNKDRDLTYYEYFQLKTLVSRILLIKFGTRFRVNVGCYVVRFLRR
jgi:hypothetical protein